MSDLLARVRIAHALTGAAYTYGDEALSDETLRRVREATEDGVEVGEIALTLGVPTLLGVASKELLPNGRHRAVVETSGDGGATWAAVIEGTFLRESASHGRAYADGTRDWGLTVRDDALQVAWAALDATALQDVAEAMDTAASGYLDVTGARMEGDPAAPVSQASRWWLLADTVAAAVAEAGLTLASAPDPFPHEALWLDGEPVRLWRGDTTVVFGRPHLAGAPEALHGPYPTMPEWTAAELLEAWVQQQQLGLSAAYGAFPSADVSVTITDPGLREDPDAPLALPSVDGAVRDDWDWSTEAGQLDGEPVDDAAVEYDGGVDGAALAGALYQVPARASYAASAVSLTGEAPEREAANGLVMTFPWRLCSLADDDEATVSDAGGYGETVLYGRPAYPVTEAYRPAVGGTPEQEGDGGVVRLASLVDVSGTLYAVGERRPLAPAPGEPTASMELWAFALYRRFALALGDVDVALCSVPLEDVPALLRLLEVSGGVSFQGLDWAVRSIDENRDEETADLALVRPSGGWAAEPAPDAGIAGVPELNADLAGALTESLETDDQGATTYYRYSARFEARMPENSATPEAIQWEFDPAGAFDVDAAPRVAVATRSTDGDVGDPPEDPHPLAGQQARVRCLYPSGATDWSAWVTAT